MTDSAAAVGRPRTLAASTPRHPLDTREKRTAINYALHGKGIPAKACSLCWVIKSTAEFNKKSSASDGLAAECRACRNADRARRMATDSEYRERHRTSVRESARRQYAIRKDEIRALVKQRRQEYLKQNANRVRDPNVLKRCGGQCGQLLPETEFRLNRGAKGGLRERCRHCEADAGKRARRACLEAYGHPVGWICYLCALPIAAESEAWVDHVIPQSKGGPNTVENLRWTHDLCNMRRGDKPLTAEQLHRLKAANPACPSDRVGGDEPDVAPAA